MLMNREDGVHAWEWPAAWLAFGCNNGDYENASNIICCVLKAHI